MENENNQTTSYHSSLVSSLQRQDGPDDGEVNHEKKFLGNPINIVNPSKIGNIRVLLYLCQRPIITIGPEWYLALGLFMFNFSIQVVVNLFLYNKLEKLFGLIGNTLFGIWTLSYLITVFKNPGIPNKENYMDVEKSNYIDNSESELGYLTCSTCNVFVRRNITIGHCLSCQVCIIGKKLI